jgi:hypothetical protein
MARARPSSPPDPLDRLVGEAPALQTLRAQIRHLARFDAVGHPAVPTVLLQGKPAPAKGWWPGLSTTAARALRARSSR